MSRRPARPPVRRSARYALPAQHPARLGRRTRSRSVRPRPPSPRAVRQHCDRVAGVGVEVQHLFGGVACQRPADRGRVEASGDRALSSGRNRQRPNRPAMAAQLRERVAGQPQNGGIGQEDEAEPFGRMKQARMPLSVRSAVKAVYSCLPHFTPGLSRSRPLLCRSSRYSLKRRSTLTPRSCRNAQEWISVACISSKPSRTA